MRSIGHHGIFSLTPIWLLALPGIWLLGRRYGLRDLALLIGGVTVVCVTFYICFVKPLDRNYGGMTSGFRWVFWFAPLWLLAVLPAADWLAATALAPSDRLRAAGALGHLGQLPDLEPVDISLANEFLPLHGLGEVLSSEASGIQVTGQRTRLQKPQASCWRPRGKPNSV